MNRPTAVSALTLTEATGRFLGDGGFLPNTRRAYAFALAALADAVGQDTDVATITSAQVADLLATRWGGADVAAATYNRHRSTLRSFFAWCAAQGWLDANPAAQTAVRVTAPDARPRTPGPLSVQAAGAVGGDGLDLPLPTPVGWTTLGDLRVGDVLFRADGHPVAVTAVSRPYVADGWRVTLSGGGTMEVPAEQRWNLRARSGRRGGRVPPARLAGRLTEGRQARPIYSVAVADALQLPDAELPLEPYVLGAWLGDGHTGGAAVTSGDEDRDLIRSFFAAAGFRSVLRPGTITWGAYGLHRILRQSGLLGHKHVPAAYLRGSFAQRLALLQGLMDTDGTINAEGQAEFGSTLWPLAEACTDLVRTLGLKARVYEDRAMLDGVDCGPCWRVSFWPPPQLPVFRLPRKANRQRQVDASRSRHEYLHHVEPAGPLRTRDVLLSDTDGQFLAGTALVPVCDARPLAVATPEVLRVWGRANGFTVGDTGPIRQELVEAYQAAVRMLGAKGPPRRSG